MILTWLFILVELCVRSFIALWSTLKLPFNLPLFLSLSKRLKSLIPLKRWENVLNSSPHSSQVHLNVLHPITFIQHTIEMAHFWGLEIEEHLVVTEDGYILTIHRLINKNKKSKSSFATKPVLMWHGFMMNSQVWLAHPSRDANLAIRLCEMGFDVWLANARGNKYSHKHVKLSPSSSEFWDFCIDHLALFDLPATVNYILDSSGNSSLVYVGFSQGTTICFAALSLIPELRSKISLFIALSPSTKPHGLTNSFISSAVRASPELIYLMFGRKSLLPSVHFYQSLVPPSIFVSLIDTAVSVLFDWKSDSMSFETKLTAYQHLYSLCSVKLMVHWFQIIREGRFQMYDDIGKIMQSGIFGSTGNGNGVFFSSIKNQKHPDETRDFMLFGLPDNRLEQRKRTQSFSAADTKFSSPAVSHFSTRFPTEQLKYNKDSLKPSKNGPPIALFYGGSDTLLDMQSLLDGLRFPTENIEIPTMPGENVTLYDARTLDKNQETDDSPVVFLKCVTSYEHVCFLWGDEMKNQCFDDIFGLIKEYGR